MKFSVSLLNISPLPDQSIDFISEMLEALPHAYGLFLQPSMQFSLIEFNLLELSGKIKVTIQLHLHVL